MTETPAPAARTPRWIKITLVVSLSLNLLIAGGAVGMLGRHVFGNGAPPRMADTGGAYTQALRPQDRRDIGRAMAEHYRQHNPGRSEARAEYQAMIRVLSAEPFDRDAAQAVLDRQAGVADARRDLAEKLLLDRLEQMSAKERKAFVARLTAGLSRP